MCHGIGLAKSYIFRETHASSLIIHTLLPNLTTKPKMTSQPRQRSQVPTNRDHPIQDQDLDGILKAMRSRVMSLQKTTQVPRLGSLLIGASDSGECSLCGRFFVVGEDSDLSETLPCVNEKCVPCAKMWKLLSSHICAGCYADFACPKVATNRADLSSSHMDLDRDDCPQQQSPSDSQTVFHPSPQDVFEAFYNVDVDSDGVTMCDPGIPWGEVDDETRSVSELNDEDLQEALNLANSDAGTNFTMGEIKDELPRSALCEGNKTQLIDTLTQFLNLKASASDEDEGEDEIMHGSEGVDSTSQKSSPRCVYCGRRFKTLGHLRLHMQIHMIFRRTCKKCGEVLENAVGRRNHERKCQEADGEREERLRKAKIAKRKNRLAEAGRNLQKQERRVREDGSVTPGRRAPYHPGNEVAAPGIGYRPVNPFDRI